MPWRSGWRGSHDDDYNYRDTWREGAYASSSRDDALRRAATRLGEFKKNLEQNETAQKAYLALKQTLSENVGQRFNFHDVFGQNLGANFSDVHKLEIQQIGSWNQWKVSIGDLPPMTCSVRMEVVSHDDAFIRDIKATARAVRDTLLKDHSWWKRKMGSGKGDMREFMTACRSAMSSSTSHDRSQKAFETEETCKICGRSVEDDLLAGTHMCVVTGSFECNFCHKRWTSYRGRLRVDGKTLMQQLCKTCGNSSTCKDWKVDPNRGQWESWDDRDEDNWDNWSRQTRGQHEVAFCEACKEFGNCMGVFYDPFVLTIALKLHTKERVTWSKYSDQVPDILVANFGEDGTSFPNVQVSLQPHVYVDPDHAAQFHDHDRAQKGVSQSEVRVDRGNVSRGAKHDTDYDRHSSKYGVNSSSQASASSSSQPARNPRENLLRDGGGVKDAALFNNFVSQAQVNMMPPAAGNWSQPAMNLPMMYSAGNMNMMAAAMMPGNMNMMAVAVPFSQGPSGYHQFGDLAYQGALTSAPANLPGNLTYPASPPGAHPASPPGIFPENSERWQPSLRSSTPKTDSTTRQQRKFKAPPPLPPTASQSAAASSSGDGYNPVRDASGGTLDKSETFVDKSEVIHVDKSESFSPRPTAAAAAPSLPFFDALGPTNQAQLRQAVRLWVKENGYGSDKSIDEYAEVHLRSENGDFRKAFNQIQHQTSVCRQKKGKSE